MRKGPSNRQLRVQVKYIDGVWECTFGGEIPVMPGTPGELVLDRSSIADKSFLKRMEAKSRCKVLDEGTKLLVWFSIKEREGISEAAVKHLIPYSDLKHEIATQFFLETWTHLHFIEVYLDAPNEKQAKRLETDTGGLWLLIQGMEATGLASTTIRLPESVSKEPVRSLNHAFTKLSEVYEPRRISHTGNVYSRILYKARNGKWYPLELLRTAALEKKGQEIVRALWTDFMARMTGSILS